MPYSNFDLPHFPVLSDMWQELRATNKPIVVYGMGNGADKLFDRFFEYGITVSGVFASDGFVRGHSYKGFKVKSLAEIKEEYEDFVIVVSFGSRLEEVIELFSRLDAEFELYIPDMPIANTEEYFDKDFYNLHYEEIKSAYSALYDDTSRAVFASILHYKLSGKLKYLLAVCSDKEDKYTLLNEKRVSFAIDAGAYNGDTLKEFIVYFNELSGVCAIEPDKRNYKKLKKTAESIDNIKIEILNSAVWNDSGRGELLDSGNRNSTLTATASYQHENIGVDLVSIDNLCHACDYIKYDVEGAEYEALVGSDKTITMHRPMLSVSLYHRSRDIFFLINYLKEKYPFYRFYLRRQRCVPAWEIDLILIPT